MTRDSRKDVTRSAGGSPAEQSRASDVTAFLDQARRVAPTGRRARLIFALDATMSRQPTWDLACKLQAEMFAETAAIGGLDVQLVYFRGFAECRASEFVRDARALTSLMTRIDCRGGTTQIGRVLKHVRAEAKASGTKAFIYVGDAMEEELDHLCALAGELGLLGVRGFFFHEGSDMIASRAFREMARLTGGAYERFDPSAPHSLAALLRAAAAYAAGGRGALERLAATSEETRRLLTQVR